MPTFPEGATLAVAPGAQSGLALAWCNRSRHALCASWHPSALPFTVSRYVIRRNLGQCFESTSASADPIGGAARLFLSIVAQRRRANVRPETAVKNCKALHLECCRNEGPLGGAVLLAKHCERDRFAVRYAGLPERWEA